MANKKARPEGDADGIDDTGPTGPHSPTSDAGPQGPIEIPDHVREIFGGNPIPPPPMPRPSVHRVGTAMSAQYADTRGLLASRRPDRRASLARIDTARVELSGLVDTLTKSIAKVRPAAKAAAADPETCELESFAPDAVEEIVAELEAVLKKHLG